MKNDEEEKFKAKRAKRNVAILMALIAFMAIIYGVSLLKMAGN